MDGPVVVYDLEIVKAIAPRDEPRTPGIEYCDGWHDHANMGISVLCALELHRGHAARPRVFMVDNLAAFQVLVCEASTLVSFNGIAFDNKVLAANGISVPEAKCYDILRELWIAAGLGPTWPGRRGKGFTLDATLRANGLPAKTGNGALAPIQWQRGERGAVIDYCLADVWLTARLLTRAASVSQVLGQYQLLDPRDPSRRLTLRMLSDVARGQRAAVNADDTATGAPFEP